MSAVVRGHLGAKGGKKEEQPAIFTQNQRKLKL